MGAVCGDTESESTFVLIALSLFDSTKVDTDSDVSADSAS
jgi:hypothetical protein